MSESNDRRIDDATPDTNVTGTEKVPVSDGGAAKFLTVEQLKDFVATKFAALQNAADVTVSSDGVYIKKNGELKPVSANVFADALISFMFGKDAEADLASDDEIVINRGGTAKVATVESLANIVKEIVQFDALDIASLDYWSGDIGSTLMIVSEMVGPGVRENKKVALINLNGKIWEEPEIATGQDLTEDDSEIVVCDPTGRDGGATVKSVLINDLPFGKGDVKGPSANTSGKIPTWNGDNTKTLTDGLNVASSVTSGSGTTDIPHGLAVYNAVKDKANAPAQNTDGNIPRWSGANSKTLNNGLGFSTSMGITPSDGKVLSEKAVSDAIASAITAALQTGQTPGAIASAISSAISTALTDGAIGTALAGKVGAPSYSTNGYIPQWDSTSKTLKNGMQVVTEIGTSASNDQIPTAQAVKNAITGTDTSNLVKAPYSTTQYKVPRWSSTQKTLEDGFAVTDSLTTYGSSNEIPTTNAMIASRGIMNTVITPPADGTSGFKQYAFVLCTDTSNMAIYVNVGGDTYSRWIKFAPAT